MNIGQVKIFSWVTAALLTLGLGVYVWRFVSRLEERRRIPDAQTIQTVLDAVPVVKEKASDIVSYEDVRRLFLPSCERCKNDPNCHHFNWTGKPPPPPPETSAAVVDTTPKRTPVTDLVRILMVQVDVTAAKQSKVFLKYKAEAKVAATGIAGGFILHEGDKLAEPQDKIRVLAIKAEGVVFAFDDATRTPETLAPDEFPLRSSIVEVGPDGVVRPSLTTLPTSRAQFNPAKTTPRGNNEWDLGRDDMAFLAENYPDVLSNDIRWARHHDPKTGKLDGIEITGVTEGSIAARHGAHEGDIVKSINGTPVTSTQDAIHFVKTHQNEYTTWEVVVESHGKLTTMIYHSPAH